MKFISTLLLALLSVAMVASTTADDDDAPNMRGSTAASSRRLQDEPTTNTSGRPNILFIPVDDLNNWVGYMGVNPQSKTPNFDRLSAMGLSFTNAHASVSLSFDGEVV
mmetsp:Transcript_22734/g.65527  ORF Transcript_22734/g.65527 Transcript_22734/m.65527 type:complete len:108 (+) Transcript_22734:278-601(+)